MMESNDKSKEIDTKNLENHTCYYCDDIININNLDLNNILKDKNHMKIFWFAMLHTKLLMLQSFYVLFEINRMDILEKNDWNIRHYFILSKTWDNFW